MGISIALNEALVFDDRGRLLNPNLTDYKVSRIGDIPKEMKVVFLGVGQKDAPFGAKGIGELTMIPWPAAIANAVYNAIRVRIRELPLNRDRLLTEVKKQRPELIEELRRYLIG